MHLQMSHRLSFFTYSATVPSFSDIRKQNELPGVLQKLIYEVKRRMNACHHNHPTKRSLAFYNYLNKVS